MEKTIQEFVDSKKIAIAGVSRDSKKFGNHLLIGLEKKGYEVFPLNPHVEEIEGRKCYQSVVALPADVDSVIIATSPGYTDQVVEECALAGIKRIWMIKGAGNGAATDTAIDMCKAKNIKYVHGLCPMMFFDGSGLHGFHYWIRKNFGKMPAEMLN